MLRPWIVPFAFSLFVVALASEGRAAAKDYPPVGSYVRLHMDSTELKGKLISSDVDHLVVRIDGNRQPTVVDRRDVTKFQLRRSNQGRTLLYAGVGGGAGMALGFMALAAVPKGFSNVEDDAETVVMLLFVPAGMLLGVAVSALTKGPDRWTSVPIRPSVGFDPVHREWGASVSLGF